MDIVDDTNDKSKIIRMDTDDDTNGKSDKNGWGGGYIVAQALDMNRN